MAPARRSIELFLSLGVGTVVLTGTIPPSAQVSAQPMHHAGDNRHRVGEGGEGGEGGEAGQAPSIRGDVDLLVALAQMQGHLLVAQELLGQGRNAAAEPHVGHPVDELYGALEPVLQQRRIQPFLSTLEELRQQVRLNPAAPATAQKLIAARKAIALAGEQGVPAAVRSDPATVRAVVRQLAAAAAEEYTGAVAEGRVVEVIEYQDARGFLLEAQRLLKAAIAGTPGAAGQLAAAQAAIGDQLRAFPAPMPPQKTVVSPEQLVKMQERL